MTTLPNAAADVPMLNVQHENHEGFKVQQNITPQAGALDGSVADINRLLEELAALTGHEGTKGIPVLELQFGDILTKTSVETSGGAYLLVTAFLPKCKRSRYSPLTSPQPIKLSSVTGEIQFLWHADEGHYIGVRKIPVQSLTDERSVMDAILTTSDQADAWFSSIQQDKHRG